VSTVKKINVQVNDIRSTIFIIMCIKNNRILFLTLYDFFLFHPLEQILNKNDFALHGTREKSLIDNERGNKYEFK
jgi:hypothetical protein